METKWQQTDLERYISDKIEENLNLDYKAADSLGKTDGKIKEITKDVSAMANAAGGTIIYGISEYQIAENKHLPERLDGIDRTEITKEWLDQVISTIQPVIKDLVIHPVPLNTGHNHIAYVVEIPKSTTAHQARDLRYYRRFNFMSVPMEDYAIRDVMNRGIMPNAVVKFGFTTQQMESDVHQYTLTILVKNEGIQVINDFKLEFVFPNYIQASLVSNSNRGYQVDGGLPFTYRSVDKLFPEDEFDVTGHLYIRYSVTEAGFNDLSARKPAAHISWILYADNMTPKRGNKPFAELYEF